MVRDWLADFRSERLHRAATDHSVADLSAPTDESTDTSTAGGAEAHPAGADPYGPVGSDLREPEGWRRTAEWQRPKPDLSLGVDARSGGVAMFVKGTGNWKLVGETGANSWYFPYATGLSVLPDENEDHDDAATIDANMCYSVWLLPKGAAAAYCYCSTGGDPGQTCLSAPPLFDSEEPCPPAG